MFVEGFDNSIIEVVHDYRRQRLADADHLRRAVADTRELGALLTGDMLARGRATLYTLDVRNQRPSYPPLFLTFLECPDWIRPTDAALVRLRYGLRKTPSRYRQFLRSTAAQPVAGLFELNVFAALDRDMPPAEPQPLVARSPARRSDIRVVIDNRNVYIEATVLGEGKFWENVERYMQINQLSVHSTSGPGPAADAYRIVGKIGEELRQIAPSTPNIIAVSIFGAFPTDLSVRWAIDDLWRGGPVYGVSSTDGSPIADLTNLKFVDSIFEFSRTRLRAVHVNPQCDPLARLSDAGRDRLVSVLSQPMMIR